MTVLSCKPCDWSIDATSWHADRVYAEHRRTRHTPVRWRDEPEEKR